MLALLLELVGRPLPLTAEVLDVYVSFRALHMGGCQNYGPLLGPYYNTAPTI